MGLRIDSRPVVDALEMALARRATGEGQVARSDRGSRYASEHYQRLLADHEITCSMGRRANWRDNAPMESSFASLKKELTHGEVYATREEVRASIFEYIEAFYNLPPSGQEEGRQVILGHAAGPPVLPQVVGHPESAGGEHRIAVAGSRWYRSGRRSVGGSHGTRTVGVRPRCHPDRS